MSQLFNLLKNMKSTRLFSNVKRKKVLKDFKLLPVLIPTVSIVEDTRVFGNDFQKVMNFLNRISSVLGVTIPRPEAIETTKNVSHALYEVLAHNQLAIPEKFRFIFKKEYADSISNLTFFAQAKSISEAKQRALFNLAESLYATLKSGDLFLPNADQDPKKVLPFIKFNISEEQHSRLQNVIDAYKGIENETVASDGASNSLINNLNADRIMPSVEVDSRNFPRPEPLQGKLPIYRNYQEIVDSVENNQVTIVSATTGSGKTTQIPKFIMNHFQADQPSIIVTQPRRVAAISLATRLAHELGEHGPGQSVGYSVRFDTILPNPNQSNIRLLIKKLQSMNDDTMTKCTHLILDEIHERDINTDILLLAVRRLLGINKRLKVVIMSATLDAEKFHNYFSESGKLKVGRPIKIETATNFPVASFHLEDVVGALKKNRCFPAQTSSLTRQFMDRELSGDDALPEIVPVEIISHMAKCLHDSKPEGSILCFLPGWEDIVAVKTELEQILFKTAKPFRIYCIHSSVPPEITQSIFQKTEEERKIILATNIAESSITIPDVAFVIDSGKQKINMFNPSLRMNSLKTTWISKSNSIQRLGRVGRTQPGEYYLLCSRTRQLSAALPPEILRIGLEDVCLTIKGLGFEGKLRDIAAELLDTPNKIALRDAVKRLIQLDALEEETENITELGKILSSIPLNPSLGKALVLSHVLGRSRDMLTIAAGVGERILRVPRFEGEKEQFLDFIRKLRNDYEDDHHLLLEFHDKFQKNQLPRMFDSFEMRFISTLALKRICKVRSSLEAQLNNLLPNDRSGNTFGENVQNLLTLSAFYPDIAFKIGKRNHYLLPGAISAEAQKESMQYVESIETLLSKLGEDGAVTDSSFGPAKALVFEELFDAGHSMIVKSGIVDSLFTILFADNVLVFNKTIYVDNWIRITSDDPEALNLLLEIRKMWKSITRQVLIADDGVSIQKFKTFINELALIWNSNREIEIR